MGGSFICPEYKLRWISEYKEDLANEKDQSVVFADRKLSRFYFTRDLPFWHYPPFCRYGYECKKCWQVRKLWEHCSKDDFEEIYQQVISGVNQLTLF